MKLHPEHHASRSHRSGIILVLVLVVVMMLSFAVYSFANLMVVEYSATRTGLTHFQRRELSGSGIELAAIAVRQEAAGTDRDHRISLQQPIRLKIPGTSKAEICVLRTIPAKNEPPAFGLLDESGKFNINTLPLEKSRRKWSRQRLVALPGVTEQIADAILDWMDEDDETSEYGAETSFYTAQSPPRRPRQGRFTDLEELLLVRGISPLLLYGEDQNRNFLLDPEEDDGGRNWPADNGDGILQRGLSDLITVQSREGTVAPNGRRKVNLNQPILSVLYDQLEPIFGTELATYIVAWRMNGAVYLDEPRPDQGEDLERRRLERLESVAQRLEAQLSGTGSERAQLSTDQLRRGGLTLNDGPMKFNSLLDLFGGQVRVSVDGKDQLLQSPWAGDPGVAGRMLPLLEQLLTTTDGDALVGRININEASEPVLRSLPEISETMARAIVQIQTEIRQARTSTEFTSVAWLAGRGLVSFPQLRAMGPYITTRGDVRSGIAIGRTDDHDAVAATAFTLDCSSPQDRILYFRDFPPMSRNSLSLR